MSDTPTERARRFRDLHHGPVPLLMPDPWDIGSARLLVSLGFEALATTSSGLPRPGAPTVEELAALGVARISVGGSFAWCAYAAVVDAATELRDRGTYGYAARVPEGLRAAHAAFGT